MQVVQTAQKLTYWKLLCLEYIIPSDHCKLCLSHYWLAWKKSWKVLGFTNIYWKILELMKQISWKIRKRVLESPGFSITFFCGNPDYFISHVHEQSNWKWAKFKKKIFFLGGGRREGSVFLDSQLSRLEKAIIFRNFLSNAKRKLLWESKLQHYFLYFQF